MRRGVDGSFGVVFLGGWGDSSILHVFGRRVICDSMTSWLSDIDHLANGLLMHDLDLSG